MKKKKLSRSGSLKDIYRGKKLEESQARQNGQTKRTFSELHRGRDAGGGG